jgi:hypothetical protein
MNLVMIPHWIDTPLPYRLTERVGHNATSANASARGVGGEWQNMFLSLIFSSNKYIQASMDEVN